MGYTIAQKILKKHIKSGDSVSPGNEISINIDHCLTQDSTGTMVWLEFESLGFDKVKCEKAVSYCDHTSLSFKGESSDDHKFLQSAAAKFGAYFSKSGNGVCHQIHYERFGIPGKTMLGSDSHTPTAGGIGMMGIGVGGMDVAVALGGGEFYLKVPEIIKVNLTGNLRNSVSAKDIILEIIKRLTVKGGIGKIIEYGGSALKMLSIPERATITNMGAETGATTSLFPSDDITRKFFKSQSRENKWVELYPDEDAEYNKIIEINLDELGPKVAMPGMPDNVKDITEVIGTKIDQVFIGSCTNGSVRDIKVAGEILKGNKIDKNIDLIVSPGSKQVLQTLMMDDTIKNIIDAGGRIIDPGCNACIGVGFVPGYHHLSLRTVNRNWFGRGGSKDCRIALCSPEIAAYSAIKGKISNPTELDIDLNQINIPNLVIDDYLIVNPDKDEVKIIRGPNIIPLKLKSGLETYLTGNVMITVDDNISTDDILPAGPLTQHLRSNLPKISEYTFYYIDKQFFNRCEKNNGGFIVAGNNYGQGSSREHAALAPKYLGIKAVLAKSFARIHRSNLVNCGIVPIICNTDDIKIDDEISINVIKLKEDRTIKINLINQNKTIFGEHDLSNRECDIIQAGGILEFTKQKVS